jgi:hypothetical protein
MGGRFRAIRAGVIVALAFGCLVALVAFSNPRHATPAPLHAHTVAVHDAATGEALRVHKLETKYVSGRHKDSSIRHSGGSKHRVHRVAHASGAHTGHSHLNHHHNHHKVHHHARR